MNQTRPRADEQLAHGGVAILSPCGWGNLGDAAIVDSVVEAVRRRRPDWPIAALTLNPSDTARRHGVPALTCSGLSGENYGIAFWKPKVLPGQASPPPAATAPVDEVAEPQRLTATIKRALGPTARPLLSVKHGFEEARHRTWVTKELGRPAIVVVAGGGQLDEFWGGPLGHPYVLWRWAQFAHRANSQYVVLSVGTGSLPSRAGRWFVHQALAGATYRSFRDRGSKEILADRLVEHDPVVPDLAFGLEPSTAQRSLQRSELRVGISPMCYCKPGAWPIEDEARYTSYLERLAQLSARLLQSGTRLTLFTTTRSDRDARDDLLRILGPLVPEALLGEVSAPETDEQGALYEVLREMDLVVASRLHGALLSHVHGLPVFALSYERKVVALMRDAGHAKYCTEIDSFDPLEVERQVSEMFLQRSELVGQVKTVVAGYRARVQAQYDEVFGRAG